jgi:hypothetical protein
VGTEAAKILFIGEQEVRGSWQGLAFNSNAPVNELTHVEVAYGGGGSTQAANVTVGAFDRLRLSHTVLRASGGVGLLVGDDANLPDFEVNTFRDNTAAGVRLPLELLGALDTSSDYLTGNGNGFLDVLESPVHRQQTWRVTSLPIRVSGQSTIWSAVVVSPGANFRFASEASWNIQGSLSAVGTETAKIRFTGEQEVRGSWQGLAFNSNAAANELTHVEVAYGGGNGGSQAANVTIGTFDRLRITNSLIRDSAGWGLYAGASAVIFPMPLSAGNNTFINNVLGGSNIP